METIIKQIIECEVKAQKILGEVDDARKSAAYNMDKEIVRLRDDILGAVKCSVEEKRAENDAFVKLEIEKNTLLARKQAESMRENFARNREEWVRSLVDHILGR